MRKLFLALVVLYLTASIAYAGIVEKHYSLDGADVVVYYSDPSITPGKADPAVTQRNIKSTICVSGYTKDKRKHQTSKIKKDVLARYDIPWSDRSNYEDDHFLALTDGGCDCCDKKGKANDTDCSGNRWPQMYCDQDTAGITCFGAREKDVVEANLNRRVCKGKITLHQAQNILRTDWFAEYVKIKGLLKPTLK